MDRSTALSSALIQPPLSTNHHHHPPRSPRMAPGFLPMPPAPIVSDLPVDKELLQRWSSGTGSPNGSPAAQQRPSSYSKRHASFNSPREVPLPSPSLSISSHTSIGTLAPSSSHFFASSSSGTTPSITAAVSSSHTTWLPGPSSRAQDVSPDYFPAQPRSASLSPHSGQSPTSTASDSSSSSSSANGERYPIFEDVIDRPESGSGWTSRTSEPTSPRRSDSCILPDSYSHSRSSSSSQFEDPAAALGPSVAMTQHPPRTTTIATPIFPYPRPYSLPGVRTNLANKPPSQSSQPPAQAPIPESIPSPRWPDRNSSASLPLPSQVPYHTLPRTSVVVALGAVPSQDALGIGGATVQLGRIGVLDNEAGDAHAERVRQAHQSEVGEIRRRKNPQQYPRFGPPSSSSSSSERSNSVQTSSSEDLPPPPPSPGMIRRRRSPSPPYRHHQHPRPATSPSYTPSSHSHYEHLLSQLPPPRSPSPSVSSLSSYPDPEPPTILAPTVSPAPFLSHAPPPPECLLEVETTQHEYRLVVRLPGFKRDGITLATKKRRILHVVADNWENGGGHFERRISFGYDADLVQVRAEFDGEVLRVTIPRRIPPVELVAPSRPGPFGRAG